MDLQDLEDIIKQRLAEGAEDSYTVQLKQAGRARIAKKFGEEAVETLIEGVEGNQTQLILESVDMLYHWMLLLNENDVTLADIYQELSKRAR